MSMGANGEPPQEMPQVQPSPLPMQWVVATAVGQRGEKMVVLQFITPQGVSVFFLPADSAEKVGLRIAAEGKEARSGLVVPQFEPPEDIFGGKGPPV